MKNSKKKGGTLSRTARLPLRALLRWPCDQSPLGNVNNRLLSLQIATKTFDPLPLVCMIKALQSSELRKHSLVRLNDLLLTERVRYRFPCFNLAIPLSSSSSGL